MYEQSFKIRVIKLLKIITNKLLSLSRSFTHDLFLYGSFKQNCKIQIRFVSVCLEIILAQSEANFFADHFDSKCLRLC